MEKFTKPIGTNDFLPEQMVQRNYVENIVRQTFEAYGYAQVQTPLFESFALLSAQAGEEVRQKMFTFVGSDRVDYALRPELTAPVCRLIANGSLQHLPYPYKLYYVGQCVRQEPAGREFRQAGVELIGAESVLADAEIITMPVRILEKLNVNKTKLKIGNPGIFRRIFQNVQLHPSDLGEIIMDLDALARQRAGSLHSTPNVEEIRDELNTLRRIQGSDYPHKIELDTIQELSESNAAIWAENLPRIAESTYKARWHRYLQVSEEIAACCIAVSKIRGAQEQVLAVWDKYLDGIANEEKKELIALCQALRNHDITNFEIDLGLTRGFDFYTGTVFQIESTELQLPLCGGGRYDTLIETFGGPSLPGAGFAFHFDALMKVFAQTEPASLQQKKDYFIATNLPELAAEAQRLAETLRRDGKTVEVDLMERDAQAQLDYAAQTGYEYVLILNVDEPMQRRHLKTGVVQLCQLAEL